MGIGAIIILVLLAAMSMQKCSNHIHESDSTGIAAEAILFLINVSLLVLGNPWAWAAWQLSAMAKVIFFPSDDLIERMGRSPPGYITLMLVVTVLLNGGVFALFQWLR